MSTSTRADWIAAALRLGARVGVENVGIEPLAVEVGATKGSFSWHCRGRADLLDAVLEQWERDNTHDVIGRVDAVLSAAASSDEALAALVDIVLGHPESDAAEWRILLAADHPVVGPVVRRVHERRIAYLVRLLRARGFDQPRADARARLVYSAYLGNLLLTRPAPATVGHEGQQDDAGPRAVDAGALRRELLTAVLAP